MNCRFPFVVGWVALVLGVVAQRDFISSVDAAQPAKKSNEQRDEIDIERARGLLQKRRSGEKLTADEAAYLQRAIAARQRREEGDTPIPREQTGLVPLCDMSAEDKHKGEDGGLYGMGQNLPPEAHLKAALAEQAMIQPLDADGNPSSDGKVVLISISMSNATQEFSVFKKIADADPRKSRRLTIVDCAQGGQAMAEWVEPSAQPWKVAEQRIKSAGVTPKQVQVAWIKLANKGPQGALEEHGKKLQRDTLAVIHNAKNRFPNLRIVYLGSRIYGGYAASRLNPEPYAYESAFAARWLIQDQIAGEPNLNFDADRGPVKAPVLLWGPYLWADGTKPRRSDQLVWKREDLAEDGTHPSQAGRDKVAKMLLDFFQTHETTRPWFVRSRND